MDDDQQFCLRWNNHQSTLVAVFDTLLENGTLVDCTLAAEGKCLNAHKVVLSACSPYFESLLSKHFDKHPILILKDVKFQELKAMMDYMYRGEVNISQDQLGALLKAAESLQIKGLSDNRKGETERKPAPTLPPKSPQPASTIPKVQGLTIEQRSRDDSREGSMSPGPRKKKRLRRKSEELDNHDASNSSESHSLPAQNIPSSLPAVSKMNADVPEPVETKSEILTRHKQPDELPQVPIIKEKLETHTELMLEPKSEYVEEMNEDSIEDLTLDDDDLSNMEQVDDQAGPSHGNAGEGSSQGFGGWHMGNQSQDEVFLAAQEAVGAHRDSQDSTLSTSGESTCEVNEDFKIEMLSDVEIKDIEEEYLETQPKKETEGDIDMMPLDTGGVSSSDNVNVTHSKGRKRFRRRKHFCCYCNKEVSNYARHLERNHSNERKVQNFLSLDKNSKKRKFLINQLRIEGDFCTQKITTEKKLSRSIRDYAFCVSCRQYFSWRTFPRHKRRCNSSVTKSINSEDTAMTGNVESEDSLLLQGVRKKPVPDEISIVIKNDNLICEIGRQYIRSHREKNSKLVARRYMRRLARLLIRIRQIEGNNDLNLIDLLKAENFLTLVEGTKQIAEYSEETKSYKSQSLAYQMGGILKIAITTASSVEMRKENFSREFMENMESLRILVGNDWMAHVSTQ